MAASPMIAQFHRLKREAGGALLFFRLGDFYELFFEDAVDAAPILGVALTRRGQQDGQNVPMCGVPVHAADLYLARLVRAGRRVAIAEQTGDPLAARRDGRPVERAIVRVVTPATLTEDELLDAQAVAWLAAIGEAAGAYALAWADAASGRFEVAALTPDAVAAELARLAPAELIASDAVQAPPPGATPWPALHFRPDAARARLCERFGVATLDAFGAFGPAELAAMGGLVSYLDNALRTARPRLDAPIRGDAAAAMRIDPATRASLALGRPGLLAAVDRTRTAAGARLLAQDLGQPLVRLDSIAERLEQVATLVDQPPSREAVRGILKGCPDLERALARLAAGRVAPRDLSTVADALARAMAAREAVSALKSLAPPAESLIAVTSLAVDLAAALASAANDSSGSAIADGYDAELDALRTDARDGRRLIAALEARYRADMGLTALKVRHNAVLGYHVEVPARHDAALRSAGFEHRQTLADAVRFGTPELADLAARVAQAGELAAEREAAHLERLRAAVAAQASPVIAIASWLARLDVAASHAELAAAHRWTRPELTDGTAFLIDGGRHPVVEAALTQGAFVANGCDLGADRVWLVTGPNMGGKSTFLRQNALIAVLAQAGSFVPARAARIGIVDRLFSRVGAADDLAQGRSTFMVEMVETAAILRQATERSLVILDEVGRGTSTWDGLAIAWAVVEWLHDRVGCRTLFATHYHELTRLSDRLERLRNVHVTAREWRGDLVFLHEVADGPADRSYGLAVARLAGAPEPVLRRAAALLDRLERERPRLDLSRDLPLFAAAPPEDTPVAPPAEIVRARLAALDLDALSPREAHALLAELQALAAAP